MRLRGPGPCEPILLFALMSIVHLLIHAFTVSLNYMSYSNLTVPMAGTRSAAAVHSGCT